MWGKTQAMIPYAIFLFALLVLGYVAGSLTTLADAFPSRYVQHAYRAFNALALRHAYAENPYTSNLWVPARTPQRGVTVYDAERAYTGPTLYATGQGAKAILIDMGGRTLHEWKRPFHDIWDESAAVRNPVPERQIHFRKVLALPNGDLLAIYAGIGDTPWGYGMVKLDWDSNVIWKNLDTFHHDFAVADDGRIYGLTHHFRMRPVKGQGHLKPPLLEDFLVVLSPEGRTLQKISLLDAVQRSRYSRKLWRILHFSLWDPLHTNDVDVLDRKEAAALRPKVPIAAPGQVLLSFRELDGGTIALFDVEKEEIVWALTGSWRSQHDPDILPNGNILIFDNLGDFGSRNASRVIEVDPATGGIVWSYSGAPGHKLFSYWRGVQQRLPNGNTLITESNGARLLEVTPGGDIVWEFINPIRGKDGAVVPVVVSGTRLNPNATVGELRAVLSPSSLPVEISSAKPRIHRPYYRLR
ncbi:MAG: arylsulfotransferase family protein [Nitrococcus sp.]|nr:arylsulfotransferase family protein [Nitrococcus sp.]